MGEVKLKSYLTNEFLEAKTWEKVHGESYEVWRKDRWASSCTETQKFLEHLLPLGTVQGEKRLMPHQAESLQRVIYSFEHLHLNPLMTTLATGTGKTVVMASVMAWLACLEKIANTFILFCPNTIVRDRLRRDFESLNVFEEFNLFPLEYQNKLESLSCSIVEGFENFSNLMGKDIIVANRHQFQKGYSGGNDHLAFLQRESGNLAIFNDEAHNTRGKEYSNTLRILKPKTQFRLDVTATPDRADNLRPQSHEVYSLSVVEAITGSYRVNRFIDPNFKSYPSLVKDVVVQRPLIKKLEAIQQQELTFEDAHTHKKYTVREINWEDWPKKKNIQLVMDPGGMKMQLQLAYDALERKKRLAKGRYKPVLFVIAPSIIGAEKAIEMMRTEFNLNPLLVTDESHSREDVIDIYEKKDLRQAAANLGHPDSPYDSVVSVYMLREGWDVPEVSVMCFLRGFGSPLFARQVLGRGLRLIRSNGLADDRSIQELTVIDHPCLDLDDLWIEIDALVQEGDEIIRQREILRGGDSGLGNEELENQIEQIVIRPELLDLLKIPTAQTIQGLTTERALDILEQSLVKIKEHRSELIITGAESDRIERLQPKRKVESIEKFNKTSIIPQSNEKSRESLQKCFTKMLLEWSKDYSERDTPLFSHTDEIYRTILKGFETYMFQNQAITNVSAHVLFMAQNSIPQLRESITYEMNHRIYSEEVLINE